MRSRHPTAKFAIALFALALLVPAAAAAPGHPDVPDGAGIRLAGVNLFDFIDWRSAAVSAPCGFGEFETGPDNRVTFRETRDGISVPIAACAEIRVPYRAPYPAHHMHLRFLYELAGPSPLDRETNDVEATLAIEGRGAHVPPASFTHREHLIESGIYSRWIEDPIPDLPIFFAPGAEQTGTIVWNFSNRGIDPGAAPLGPLASHRVMEALLVSHEVPADHWFLDEELWWAPAHIEYSFVDLPDMRVERHRVQHGDRVHDETHFVVQLDDALLSRYGASIQFEMDRDMAFSHIVLPNGSIVTQSGTSGHPSWLQLRFEHAQLEVLVSGGGTMQVTVPVTLVAKSGPGTYVLVAHRPAAAAPAVDATKHTTLVALAFVPALVGAVAARNVTRYARLSARRPLAVSNGMPTLFVAVSIAYVAFVAYTSAIGWTEVSRAGAGHLASTTVVILLLFVALYTALAWRSSDHFVQAMLRDLEERKRLAASLEESNTNLALFASTAAHDLAAPLRSVRGFTEILATEHRDALDEEGRELLDHAIDGARRMQTMISDLLEFSRFQAGRVSFGPVDLDDAYQEASANVATALQASGGTLRSHHLPEVRGSRPSLVRLLQNILSNAIKFRSPDRVLEITINAATSHGEVHLSIADNGIGMPPDDLEKVFEPFYRASRQERYEGAGLGLAIVRRIAEAHGGRAWIESETGIGTTVHVILPLNTGSASASDPNP